MTRIGALLSGKPILLAMHLTGETTSPRSKSYRPNCVDQYANAAWLFFSESITECHLIHKAFFEIAVAAHTKFKDADAIANAIGCAPLPEILIQNFLIPWLEQGLRYAPAKNRYDGTKSDCVTILQLSISDTIAIDLCPVR